MIFMMSAVAVHQMLPPVAAGPLDHANAIAATHGFADFEALMLAAESDELDPHQEREVMQDLRPLLEWALDQQANPTDEEPQGQLAAIMRLIEAVIHFFFGYSSEELEKLQQEWQIDELVLRVRLAEVIREARRGSADTPDPEAPATPITPML